MRERRVRRRPLRSDSVMTAMREAGSAKPLVRGACATHAPGSDRSDDPVARPNCRPLSAISEASLSTDSSVDAATTTRHLSEIISPSRRITGAGSWITGPQPDACTRLAPGASGAETMFRIGARRPPASSRSGSTWRRGNATSASRAQDDASARARSSSSASRSRARSTMRRGSTSTTSASVPTRSVSSLSSAESQGIQLSMPSKTCPSASRSQCSRPHGSVDTRPRAFSCIAPS